MILLLLLLSYQGVDRTRSRLPILSSIMAVVLAYFLAVQIKNGADLSLIFTETIEFHVKEDFVRKFTFMIGTELICVNVILKLVGMQFPFMRGKKLISAYALCGFYTMIMLWASEESGSISFTTNLSNDPIFLPFTFNHIYHGLRCGLWLLA